MLIELHTLTVHSPSNLNRDDFGRPKTARFGGTERARISSQSLKRAIRLSDYLRDRLRNRISTRSRDIPKLIYDHLAPRYDGSTEQLERLQHVCEAVTHALGKPDSRRGPLHISQIVFLTPDELSRLEAVVVHQVENGGKLAKPAALGKTLAAEAGLDRPPHDAVDMALFGRMTTDDANAFAEVDAAMQVMHPIATHTTVTETDYFTAVDDVSTGEGDRGSAHLNELDFNSAVYYKYFSCNFDLLAHNLNDRQSALDALVAFFDAACRIAPSGKQNSFASHGMASAALVVVRGARTPCSLAEAFERPVPPSEEGYLARSLQRLASHYCTLVRDYGFDDRAMLYYRVDMDGLPLLKPLGRARLNGSDTPEASTLAPCFEEALTLPDLWTFLRQHVPVNATAASMEG